MSDATRPQYESTIASLQETIRVQSETIESLTAMVAQMHEKLDAALAKLYGKKSERKTRTRVEVPKMAPTRAQIETKRADNRAQLTYGSVDGGQVDHPVQAADQVCAHCGDAADFVPMGAGKDTELFDYVPGYFRRTAHVVHSVACRCGHTMVAATGPQRATPRSKYGPGLAAFCVTQKCVLSTPIHRLEKLLRSHGTPVSRSTLNEIFLRVAEQLRPIYDVLLTEVRAATLVRADETPIKLMSHDKQAWLWFFQGDQAAAFVFAMSRQGKTATQVLGGTRGQLLTDGYAGYAQVTRQGGRDPLRCNSHIRRKFYEAKNSYADAQTILELYADVYRVEAEVKAAGMAGSSEHLLMRRKRAGPAMGRIKQWMRRRQAMVSPRSNIGRAITYAQNQWHGATRFLYDPNIPLDNNESERRLRIAALGRKNFYGAGSKAGGDALAILYSLTATCELVGADPFAYFRYVITAVHTHNPAEITPHAWLRNHS